MQIQRIWRTGTNLGEVNRVKELVLKAVEPTWEEDHEEGMWMVNKKKQGFGSSSGA